MELDKLDLMILGHLQQDGRKSFTEIAEDLEVAVSTIRNRYQRLVQENVLHIIGWTDPVKAGFQAYARINIEIKPAEKILHAAKVLQNISEVTFLAHTSGQYDLEVNIKCRNNKHLMEVVHEKIHKIDGVFETNTTIYFDILKWASHDISETILHQRSIDQAMSTRSS